MEADTRASSSKRYNGPNLRTDLQTLRRVAEKLVGKGPSYGLDLEKVGTATFNDKFMGVFAADTIPKKFVYYRQPRPSRQARISLGALARTEGGVYMAYDSFGRKTVSILPGLDLKTIDTDPDAEQKDHEDNCGARCIAWLIMYDIFGPDVAVTI